MAKAKRERGTGGLIRRKGCRYWYASIYVNGRTRRISTKTDVKQEAQVVLRNLLTDKDRGLQFAGDLNRLTYGNLRNALLHNYVERGNKSLRTTSEGDDVICGLPALDQFFGYESDEKPGVAVAKMTTDAARRFADQRTKEGVKAGTVNGSLALLRRMLRLAQEDGKIQTAPKIRLLRAAFPRKGFLVREQFEILLANLPQSLRPIVTFLYYCGVRLGEAQALDWSQVDLEAGLARLEADQTKNSEARIVPLPNVLIQLLADEKQEGKVFNSTNLRKAWAKACAASGLGTLEAVDKAGNQRYTGLLIHDLRRSAIKNLMKAGVTEKVAMAISGHKTRAVFDRYHIVDERDVLAAMQSVQSMRVQPIAETRGQLSAKRSLLILNK